MSLCIRPLVFIQQFLDFPVLKPPLIHAILPLDFPANDIVKFLLGFTNKGSENFIVESLDASFRYPQVRK